MLLFSHLQKRSKQSHQCVWFISKMSAGPVHCLHEPHSLTFNWDSCSICSPPPWIRPCSNPLPLWATTKWHFAVLLPCWHAEIARSRHMPAHTCVWVRVCLGEGGGGQRTSTWREKRRLAPDNVNTRRKRPVSHMCWNKSTWEEMRASNMSIKAAPAKRSQPRLEALGQPPVEVMPVDGGEDVKEGGKQSHGAAAKLRAEAFTFLMAALFPAAVCSFPFPGQRWLWAKPLQSQHSHPFSHLKTQKRVARLSRLINTQECSELRYVCFTLKPSILPEALKMMNWCERNDRRILKRIGNVEIKHTLHREKRTRGPSCCEVTDRPLCHIVTDTDRNDQLDPNAAECSCRWHFH